MVSRDPEDNKTEADTTKTTHMKIMTTTIKATTKEMAVETKEEKTASTMLATIALTLPTATTK